jgi:hypothetical protein
MRARIFGPGITGSAGSFDTADLVSSAYKTDVKLAVLRTKQEARERGFNLTDAESYALVEKRLAAGETGVLPNYERVLDTAARMQTDDNSPRIFGDSSMQAHVAAMSLYGNDRDHEGK